MCAMPAQPKEMIVTLDTGRKTVPIEAVSPEAAAFDVMRNGLEIWIPSESRKVFYPPHRINLVEIQYPDGETDN